MRVPLAPSSVSCSTGRIQYPDLQRSRAVGMAMAMAMTGERWRAQSARLARAVSTDALPVPVATAIRSWIGAVETASPGMAEEVRVTAEDAVTSLRCRIVMTAPLETALDGACFATMVLAKELDRRVMMPCKEKAEALTALDTLIIRLQDAVSPLPRA